MAMRFTAAACGGFITRMPLRAKASLIACTAATPRQTARDLVSSAGSGMDTDTVNESTIAFSTYIGRWRQSRNDDAAAS